MLKITGQTTLSELGVELGKLGIEYLKVSIEAGHRRCYMVQLGRLSSHSCADHGHTLVEAIDNALARYLHREAEKLAQP